MSISWRSDLYGWEAGKTGFDLEEFIAFNNSIQLVKFDPKTIKDNPPVVAQKLQDLFPGFTLYQFPKISKYRPYPLRLLYSKDYGKIFELKGTNEPIYDLLTFFKDKGFTWDEDMVYRYVLFFFDNVAGRHGRFEIIDLKSTSTPKIQMTNRVNNFLELGHDASNEKKKNTYSTYENLSAKLNIEPGVLFDAVGKSIEKFFSGKENNQSIKRRKIIPGPLVICT